MATREEQIILDFEIDTKDSIKSIEDLTKANKALREERNKLNLQTEEGKKRAHEINTILDHNTKKIKDNSSALEKQRLNIGNYKSALDGIHPALGKVASGLEAGTDGFKKMTLQALRFIATPIGAVLAAIVAVFTLLKTALQQNDGLMDKFENVTNAVAVVLEVVVARVGKLGEALIALASGNFSEAIDKTAEAFGGLADEIASATRQQQIFLDASRDLEDAQRNLRIEQSKSVNQIKLLDQVAKNSNKTFDEREEALKKSIDIQKDLIETSEDLARRDLLITTRRLRVSKEFQQQENETFDAYVERLLNSSKLGGAELDKIVDKVVALENARNASLDLQQKTENDLTKIQNERAEALKKQNEALREQEALERATRRAQNVSDTSVEDPLVGAFETRAKVITDINQRMNDDLEKINKQTQDQIVSDAELATQLRIEAERQAAADIGSIMGSIGSLFKQESVESKVLSSAQALINTYLAATAALASGSKINPVFGIISAAAAVASGLASVAKINGVEFAEGGWTGPGDKWKPVGVVHADEYVTPKRVRHLPEAQPHLMALERMRLRGYADGGLVTSSISTPINQQLELANIVKNMPAPVVGVKEVTKMQNRVRVKENLSKR